MSASSSAGYESSVSSNGSSGDEIRIEIDQMVALSVTEASTEAESATKSKAPALSKSIGPAKLERHLLDGDVVGSKIITGQQLLYPQLTPDWQLIKPEHFEKVATPENWEFNLTKLQERIGVIFIDVTLLKIALTHHGCLHVNVVPDDIPVVRLSNRSLEFLGDSLLGAAAAGMLFQTKPWYQEGQLSRAKSVLVNNITLAKISAELGITDVLLWPPSFMTDTIPDDDKGRITIAAGAVESLIAAVYLDQGLVRAMEFLATCILPLSTKYATQDAIWDPVVELQYLLLARNHGLPVYKRLPVTDGSPAFTVELFVQEKLTAMLFINKSVIKAQAPSYKVAKRIAAEKAYVQLKESLNLAPGGDSEYGMPRQNNHTDSTLQ